MKAWRSHIGWVAALMLAALALGGSTPLLTYARRDLSARLGQLEEKHRALGRSLQQLRDDAATAEILGTSISAEDVVKFLLPVDRLEITSTFDALAAASRLGRFSYTLSPEQPLKQDQAGGDFGGLVQSSLSVEADAPTDVDVFKFIRELLPLLPGLASMERLSIDRIETGNDAPFAAMNARFTATINWVSNESGKAGGT